MSPKERTPAASRISSSSSFRDLPNVIVPVESPPKPGRTQSQEQKKVAEKFREHHISEDLALLRVVNSEARKHMHDQEHSPAPSPRHNKASTKHNKAAERLRATINNVALACQSAMDANYAVEFIRGDVEKSRVRREEMDTVAIADSDNAWNSMFADIETILENEEEDGGEGETEEEKTARLKRNDEKRAQNEKREQERRHRHHMGLHVASKMHSQASIIKQRVRTKRYDLAESVERRNRAAERRTGRTRSFYEEESSAQTETRDAAIGMLLSQNPTMVFQATSFYKNVNSLIGLKNHIAKHRKKVGLEQDGEDSIDEEGNSTLSHGERKALKSLERQGSSWMHDDKPPLGSVTQLASDRKSSESAVRFSTALKVIALAKGISGRRSTKESAKEQALRLPPAIMRQDCIAEEKLDELGGGAVSSAHRANLLKERAARLAQREVAELAEAQQVQHPQLSIHRRLGIGDFHGPSRLQCEVWEDEEPHDDFFDPAILKPQVSVVHEFPSELVCNAMTKLSADDIALMFSDVGAPPELNRPESGLELLERLFGGVHSSKQFPLQWLICEWVLKDLHGKMLHCIRNQRGVLSEESGSMMGHSSGDSFRKHLREVQETLSHHYTLAPDSVSWGSTKRPGTSVASSSRKEEGAQWPRKQSSQEALNATADSNMTLPRGYSSRQETKQPIRQQKLPYFPYHNDRQKVLNLNTVPPMNWSSAQAAYMTTHLRGCRSARNNLHFVNTK